MTQMGRPGLSIKRKKEVWSLWGKGESISDIGRAVKKSPGSIFSLLKLYGGIKPRKQYRSKRVLSLYEREEISRRIAANLSIRKIAKNLKRAPSTICREINRNRGIIKYRAIQADEKDWEKAKHPKICYLAENNILRDLIEEKLNLEWSPEQISGWLNPNISRIYFHKH